MIDAAAAINEFTWKPGPMGDMIKAVCRLALKGLPFSAIDLAAQGEGEQGGSGIAGTVFGSLVRAEIIEPVGGWLDGEFVQRRVRNANGNPVGVWRLRNGALARALVARHETEPAPRLIQPEMFGAWVR